MAIMALESIVIDFEVAVKKFEVLLFPSGCKTAETNFNIKLKTTISNNGDKMVVIIIKTPTSPTEFLIKSVLDKIKSIPSDK